MRYRLGRAVRLIIATLCLMLLVPFLMSKLDSGTNRSIGEDIGGTKQDSKKVKSDGLHPVMSNSLGNYEPKDLPVQSGPGEGGKINIVWNGILSL